MIDLQPAADGATEFDRVMGTRPQFQAVFIEDYRRSLLRLDPVLVELCRLRMAKLLGSTLDLSLRWRPARQAGLAEARLALLSNYDTSPLFSARERACVCFAEQFAIASYDISDDDVAGVQALLAPEEFIYFVKALSVIDQFARTAAAFDAQPGAVPPQGVPEFELAPSA